MASLLICDLGCQSGTNNKTIKLPKSKSKPVWLKKSRILTSFQRIKSFRVVWVCMKISFVLRLLYEPLSRVTQMSSPVMDSALTHLIIRLHYETQHLLAFFREHFTILLYCHIVQIVHLISFMYFNFFQKKRLQDLRLMRSKIGIKMRRLNNSTSRRTQFFLSFPLKLALDTWKLFLWKWRCNRRVLMFFLFLKNIISAESEFGHHITADCRPLSPGVSWIPNVPQYRQTTDSLLSRLLYCLLAFVCAPKWVCTSVRRSKEGDLQFIYLLDQIPIFGVRKPVSLKS